MSVIITQGPSGGVCNRLEINDFIKHEKFFSLYIQALRLFQTKASQDDPSSFFQISSIHGLPYTSWDGVKGDVPVNGEEDGTGGYCSHGNVLFPTWHRPYVVLYEQMIQKHAKEVAETYTTHDRAAWIHAAEELRQPYWDWAANSVPPDEVIALREVAITGPHGKVMTVDNPLYCYKFHPVDALFPEPFNQYKQTIRHPMGAFPNLTDDVAGLKATLARSQSEFTSKTFNMLSRIHDWQAFSNHTAGDGGNTSNSIEAIHDNVHWTVGGSLSVQDGTTKAFDPIFYLHHANVDRLLSFWSALNPTIWVTEGNSEEGTWTLPAMTPVNELTSLTPFRNRSNSFWASSDVHDMAKFGYTYPEFNDLDFNNRPAVSDAIGEVVCKLYGGSVTGDSYDWTTRIEFKQYEIGQSFGVYLFLGVPPEDEKQWDLADNYAGSHFAFVNSMAQQCANCVSQADIVVEGFVHLNLPIAKLSGLGSLDPDVVEPYLTKELQWRVKKANGEPTDLRSLEVSVYATPMSYNPGNRFPQPGERRRFPGITRGRPGGCRDV